MTEIERERIAELRRILPYTNSDQDGVDSTKRKLAIELIVGAADGEQTNRLARLALVLAEGRATLHTNRAWRTTDHLLPIGTINGAPSRTTPIASRDYPLLSQLLGTNVQAPYSRRGRGPIRRS